MMIYVLMMCRRSGFLRTGYRPAMWITTNEVRCTLQHVRDGKTLSNFCWKTRQTFMPRTGAQLVIGRRRAGRHVELESAYLFVSIVICMRKFGCVLVRNLRGAIL
jgi:hypothetical protein